MPNKPGHRRFGSIRQLPSGRYQIRYPGPDGLIRTGVETYERKGEAARALTLIEVQLNRREWTDPVRAAVRLRDYAERWIAERPGLREKTIELYRYLLSRLIVPELGGVPLSKLDTALIREWRAGLLADGVSATTTAKAYRLLRAVLNTAVNEDLLLPRNPCRIPGAGTEKSRERPVLTVPQVFALADAVPARFRAMILLATFASLRWGEVSALERWDVDVELGTVRVRQAFIELTGSALKLGPPKSRAGRRMVSMPGMIVPVVRDHLAKYVDPSPGSLVFTGPTGAPIRRSNRTKLLRWDAAVAKIGMPGLHFHDLRHTGNTLAAASGASTRDLMARMGHDSVHAAIIYQHTTNAADQAIAEALNARLCAEHDDQDDGDDGAAGVPALEG